MKVFPPIRWWLLFALIYTAASLTFWNAGSRQQDSDRRPGPDFVLPPDSVPPLKPVIRRDSPNQAVFTIPFTRAAMDRAGRYRFFLKPSRDLPRCTVQVVAEGDHHFSFSHLYRLSRFPASGFAFVAPFADDGMYWKTLGHTGPWTAWERIGLRRLEVKVFASAPLPADLELRYRADPAPAAPPSLAWERAVTNRLPLGQRFEFDFDLAGWSGNPFNYAELPVTAEVTGPDGLVRTVLPFLHQDFVAVSRLEGERIRPSGPKHFRFRYRPLAAGGHAYRLLLREAGGTNRVLREGRFDVTPGETPGFLAVSKRDPHFFERIDGRFVYLFGWNLPYPLDRPYGSAYVPYLPVENSLAGMVKMLDDLADSGGNFIRFWLSDWWNGIEWNERVDCYLGAGRYNLKNAWINDRLVEHCEKRGIYMQWETLNHVRLSWGYGWPRHPYNQMNGGFLGDSEEFWVNPAVRPLSENRLSYLVARYADSPAIQSWNLMSEPDLVSKGVWPDARAFILSQMEFVSRLDPYNHVTSSHLCLSDHDLSFFREKRLQFVNSNAYPGLAGLADDQIRTIRDYADRFAGYGKPMVVAECAGHWGGDPAWKMERDTLGAVWSGIASGLAALPLSWWWNFNYGEDLGRFYRVAAAFLKGEDPIAAGPWAPRAVEAAGQGGNLRALMAGGPARRFLFLYNFDTLSRTRAIASVCSQNRVSFEGLEPGDYEADYWDLRTGRTGAREALSVKADGLARLQPPDFTEGLAVKIGRRGTLGPALAAGGGPAVPSGKAPPAGPAAGAADWSWRIVPLAEIVAPEALARTLAEVRLALPPAARGLFPRVTGEGGAPVPFAWEFLEDGAGWRLRIPAAGIGGPLTVTAADGRPAPLDLDEEAYGLGLTVAAGHSPWLGSREQFESAMARFPERKRTRVSVVDQFENPLGDSHYDFMAVYAGPLLAPADGLYDFGCNSDDASFLRVDGREVAAWPGQHDMEVRDRPTANSWRHRGAVTLKKGLHWVEFSHQQRTGGCLARMGWRLPRGSRGMEELIAVPFGEKRPGEMAITPEWALDGRLPCRVEIRFQGTTRLAQDPCFALELRRPRTRLPAAALDGGGLDGIRLFSREGRQTLTAEGLPVEVWVWNAYARRFSLDWQPCLTAGDRRALKVLLYDIDMPLSVRFGLEAAAVKTVARMNGTPWWLPPGEGGAPFVISAGAIPLVSGRIEPGSEIAGGRP